MTLPQFEQVFELGKNRSANTTSIPFGKYDFDPFHTGLVFDLSSELRPHLFAHCFGKGMVLHHVSDLQIFHNECFWQRVDDLSGDLMDIVGPQVFQFLMNTGNDLFLLLAVSAFPQWPFICFWQRVDDLSGDLMDIVGPQVFQFLMNTGNDLFLLLAVSAFPQWPFIDRLSMPVSILSDDLFIMADVGLLLAGQASLLLQQSSFQFSDPWALIDVFVEGPVRQISSLRSSFLTRPLLLMFS